MIIDIWLGSTSCGLRLSKLGLQDIIIIKTGIVCSRKQKLQEKIKGDDIPRGYHVAYFNMLDGGKMILPAYRANLDNGKKVKAKKTNFLS